MAKYSTIQSKILRGFHPAALMHDYGLSVAQLQAEVILTAMLLRGVRLRPRFGLTPHQLVMHAQPAVLEAPAVEWRARFRAMRHFGVC